jgi:hypothetical protein
MRVAGRGITLATLGFLGAASLGFGLWSGLSSPRIADVQLHDAVANTLAASGFAVTLQNIFEASAPVAPSTPAYSSNVELGRIVLYYEAPDSAVLSEVDPSGHTTLRVTEIGSSCWVTGVSRPGVTISPECYLASVKTFLSSIGELESTTDVTVEDGVYVLSPSDSRKFVSRGDSPGTQLLTPVRLEVHLKGDFVDWIRQVGPGPIGEYLGFTDVGTAPPIMRPSGPPIPVG